jgi:hypothetical protein
MAGRTMYGQLNFVPAPALVMGLVTNQFYVEPTAAMVDVNGAAAPAPFTAGLWYFGSQAAKYFTNDPITGRLSINQLGDGTSQPTVSTMLRNSTQGLFPFVDGAAAFYVEACYRSTTNVADNWPSWWLEPVEHDLKQTDCYPDLFPSDPAKYERWWELDIDEGGFSPGMMTSIIEWYGAYGVGAGYQNTKFNNSGKLAALDRTKFHCFGLGWDGVNTFTAYLDDVLVLTHSIAGMIQLPVMLRQKFQMILGAQTHGAKAPYSMIIEHVGLWTK